VDAARWKRIQDLFHAAVDLPANEWRGHLERATDDATLVAEVLAMLEEDARGESLLDRGVADVAQRMIEGASAGPPAEAIGPYRITGVLGEGGMGVVYRAERADVGSVVAIKILRDAWLSPARRDRFAREQRLLAQLKHPSIAALHDAGALPDGTPWFVMEYVEGAAITEHCRARGASLAERLRLFRQVCEAVQHAHRNLVIHRDLKPSNILVTPAGDVKLLDFGISKRLEVHERPGDETRTGLRLMTPAYAAPEQLRGARSAVDTDVYALGVVLYELLAGGLPFDLSERTPSEAAALVVERAPEQPSPAAARAGGLRARGASARAAWADLDVLVQKAMHPARARRYATVEALLRDLDHFTRGEPLEARPDELGYRLGKFARRNARALAGGGLLLALAAGLAVSYTVRVTRARNAALAEATRAERLQRFMLSLFEGGDEQAGPTNGLLAVTLVDRGVQEARGLAAEPAAQADLYEALGGIYEKLGKFSSADAMLRAALDGRRALFGEGDPAVARSRVALGRLRTDEAKYDEAERLVREGLDEAKRRLPAGHPDVARATTALGKVLEERGDYPRALPVLEAAVSLTEAAAPGSADLATALTELANTHFYAGHYDVCRTLNERALALNRALHGARHPLVSGGLFNLGAIDFDLGHYPEAEKLYREGLAITEAWYGPDHHQTAADLTMLARALNMEDRTDEAVGMLQRALAIRERVYGKVHPSVASTLNDLGTVALLHKKYDEAAAAYGRMAEIYRSVYGGDKHYLVGIALANLASVHLAEGRFADAEPLYRRAIEIDLATLSPVHPNTGIARVKLGRTLLGERRYAEAKVESLAGYEVLRKQMNPTVSWLQKARQDLVAESEALHDAAQAARFRAELAPPPTTSKGSPP
jgi:serine/threonine protein kinase/Tfp pilus assembly protein PilF